mmetsp:Transcript_126227/g.200211  ORF Transcript_126227/g.200211 Transcript_126227/m.200211 type:complete len:1271 (-) Transcript_126227:79-3891(-)
MNMGDEYRYGLIMQILITLRSSFTAIVDEIDTVFDPNLEVNFPLTKAEIVDDQPAMLFLTLLFDLPGYPGENADLTPDQYNQGRKTMAEALVEKAKVFKELPFTLKAFDPNRIDIIAANVKTCTAPYFYEDLTPGKYKDIDGEDCATNRDMQIIHMFLQDTLFNLARMRRNVDYGLSHVKLSDSFVIPYSSANKPVEGSKFSNYLLAVGLSLQYWFLGGLSEKMFIQLVKKMRLGKAGSVMQALYNVTEPYLPDLKDTTTEGLQSYCENYVASSPADRCFPDALLKDKTLITGIIAYDVLPSIQVSGEQVTNYALNIDNHLKNFIGFSGTMSSDDIFPSRANVKADSTVESSLRSRTVDDKLDGDHMIELDMENPDMVTQLVTGKFADTNALLDCGAFLRDEKNYQVAKKILQVRNDIQAVFYYDDIKNEIVTMLKNGNVERISKSEVLNDKFPDLIPTMDDGSPRDCSSLQDNKCLSHIFLYCDQQHTVGTDLKLDYEAVASLTIATSTNLDEMMQAIMRMRNYQGLQSKGKHGETDSKVQDVKFAFQSNLPADLGTLWANVKKVTTKQVLAASRSVKRRNSNLEYRRLYYVKQPKPAESVKFAKAIFQREQDFLSPDTAESLIAKYNNVKNDLPFTLTPEESVRVDEIVKASSEAMRGGLTKELPDVEEELEMELEQELEIEIQRLHEHTDLNQKMFTNNPMQFGPMYAYCDEGAAMSMGYTVPQVSISYSEKAHVFPCVPISYWLEHNGDRSVPPGGQRAPIAASYAFSILRPQQGPQYSYNSYSWHASTQASYMHLFSEPWNFAAADTYQAAPLNASLIVAETRKNVRNVLFSIKKDDPTNWQFVFITTDEAQLLEDFCSSEEQRNADIEATKNPDAVESRLTEELKRIDKINKCEDYARKDEDLDQYDRFSSYTSSDKFRLNLRLDSWQQYDMLKNAYKDQRKVHDFLQKYWAGRTCSVFDPLAIPTDFESVLMPDAATRAAFDAKGDKGNLTKSLVEVLAVSGSQHVINRDELKPTFIKLMQTPKFSSVYKLVLEYMDEPMDPNEFSALSGPGRICIAKCKSEGFNMGKVEEQVVKGRKKWKCVCYNETPDAPPDRGNAQPAGSGGVATIVGVVVVLLVVALCAGGGYYIWRQKRNGGFQFGGRSPYLSDPILMPAQMELAATSFATASTNGMPPLDQGVPVAIATAVAVPFAQAPVAFPVPTPYAASMPQAQGPPYYGVSTWNPQAMCDGSLAEDRAIWLRDNKGMDMTSARQQVMREFPGHF